MAPDGGGIVCQWEFGGYQATSPYTNPYSLPVSLASDHWGIMLYSHQIQSVKSFLKECFLDEEVSFTAEKDHLHFEIKRKTRLIKSIRLSNEFFLQDSVGNALKNHIEKIKGAEPDININ
tara:strand:- start:291 stop:650 length:360 start_codon:yes stop_codon:yes gene_type:complete